MINPKIDCFSLYLGDRAVCRGTIIKDCNGYTFYQNRHKYKRKREASDQRAMAKGYDPKKYEPKGAGA